MLTLADERLWRLWSVTLKQATKTTEGTVVMMVVDVVAAVSKAISSRNSRDKNPMRELLVKMENKRERVRKILLLLSAAIAGKPLLARISAGTVSSACSKGTE